MTQFYKAHTCLFPADGQIHGPCSAKVNTKTHGLVVGGRNIFPTTTLQSVLGQEETHLPLFFLHPSSTLSTQCCHKLTSSPAPFPPLVLSKLERNIHTKLKTTTTSLITWRQKPTLVYQVSEASQHGRTAFQPAKALSARRKAPISVLLCLPQRMWI